MIQHILVIVASFLLVSTGHCLAEIENKDLHKCTPRDKRVSLYPECMQGSNLVLWCDYSNYTRIPDPDRIYQSKSCRNSVALFVNDSCIGDLTPDQLEKFENIKEVEFGNNRIRILRKGIFSRNRKLKRIDVSENYVKCIERGAFSGLPYLEQLHLSSNLIHEIDETTFEDVESLHELSLHNNLIKVLRNGTFNRLRKLKVLNLSGNNISVIEKEAFIGLDQLEILHLDGNRIIEFELSSFASLTNLKVLSLSHNHLITFPRLQEVPYDHMHTVDLGHNSITSLQQSDLLNLPRIQNLILRDNNLSSLQDEALFKANKELRTVDLSGNNLTEIAARLFSYSCFMEKLNVGDNRLEIFHADWYLTAISNGGPSGNDISGNKWKCDCNVELMNRHVQSLDDWRQTLQFDCPMSDNTKCNHPQFINLCTKKPNRTIVKRHHYESEFDAVNLKKQIDPDTTTITSTTVETPVSGSVETISLVLGIICAIFLIVAIVTVYKLANARKMSSKHPNLENGRQDHVEGRELI